MKIAQYILLGITSALLVCFITLFVIYIVKQKKKIEFDVKKMEKILIINAGALFVFSVAFSILNIIATLMLK